MVGVGNSISMNSATKNSDIDLLIVSENNMMWFVRILVTLIFQVLWVRKTPKKHAGRFCLSFFCETDWLDFYDFVFSWKNTKLMLTKIKLAIASVKKWLTPKIPPNNLFLSNIFNFYEKNNNFPHYTNF